MFADLKKGRHSRSMKTADDVLKFWFQELSPQMRFAKSNELDQKIRKLFLQTYEDVRRGKTIGWRTSAEGRPRPLSAARLSSATPTPTRRVAARGANGGST